MTEENKKLEREKKLRALEFKIRIKKYEKLKQELNSVKNILLRDIDQLEIDNGGMTEELARIKDELTRS